MGAGFSATDVFAMAERIERDAAGFYAKLAESAAGPLARKALLDLVKMEQEHEQVFVGLRSLLVSRPLSDPGGRYARLIARMSLDIESELGGAFAGGESADQVIQKAINFEKSTIVLFLGMKEVVDDPEGKKSIDAILKEELGHIFALSGYFWPVLRAPPAQGQSKRNPLHGQADSH